MQGAGEFLIIPAAQFFPPGVPPSLAHLTSTIDSVGDVEFGPPLYPGIAVNDSRYTVIEILIP
jgi:hypothetical protein